MDEEARLVRELYEDLHADRSAPAPEVIERTRSALRSGERPSRTVSNPVAGIVALAAVAGVTAAIVVPTLVPGPSHRDVVPASPAPTPEKPSDSTILERAAVAARRHSTPAGEHWRVRTLTGWTPEVESRTRRTYELDVRTVNECWTQARGAECGFVGVRELGAEPLSAADERIWRKDGSPSYWKAGLDGGGLGLTAKPGRGELSKAPYAHPAPPRPVLPLPGEPSTDPERLRAALLKLHQRSGSTSSAESWLYRSAVEMLLVRPGSSDLDASVFRMLADLPGLAIRGPAIDGVGREGVALTLTGEPTLPELVFDPDTGELLGANYDDDLLGYRVRMDASWTDEKPKPPSVR